MGWQIMRHSFAMVFRNIVQALLISVGPMVLTGLAVWGLALALQVTVPRIVFGFATGNPAPDVVIVILVAILLFAIVSAWIAVAWHRFILKEEYPGILPGFRGQAVVAYMLQSIGLGLILVVLLMLATTAASVLLVLLGLGQSAMADIVVSFALGLLLTYLWLRVAIVLPGLAIGEKLALRDAWTRTDTVKSQIMNAAMILVGVNVLATVVMQVLPVGPIGAGLLLLAINWILLMAGLSVLTTIYGIVVQGRKLA